MKFKLKENKRKKYNKGAFGWFQTMTPGNPEYNAKMFNHLMRQGDMPTEADMNANVMGGEAVGESLNEKFTSIIPSLKDLENNSYTFITKETYVQGDWVPLKIVLSNYYTSKDAAKITIYRVDNNRKINSYAGSYDFIVDKLKEFDIYEKPKKNESLTEAQKQNEYQITWLDYKDRKYFSHVKAYSEKQAAYMFRKNKGRGVVAKILSIDCIDDHSKDDGEQINMFGEQMKFKVKKDLLESGTVSRRKEEFIDLWNSKFGRSEFEINSSEIQQHHIDRDTTNNPRDFSNCAYLYSKNPDHLRKAHNYIHAKNLVYNYNLNDVYILSPKGQIIKATKENLDIYALKLPNGFETSDNIAEDQ